MKKLILIYCAMFSFLAAQEKREVIVMADKDSVCLFFTVPPRTMEGFNIYRRGPLPAKADFNLLNTNGPISPINDPAIAQSMIGNDWEDVTNAVRSEDAYDALRKLRRSDFSGGLVSLMYPSVAKVTGRMFVDTSALTGKEYEYKIVTVNSSGKTVDSLSKKAMITPVYPAPPTSPELEELDENLKLTWKYESWSESLDNIAVKFYVYRKTGKENFQKVNTKTILRDDAAEPEFLDAWLQNGQEYSYYITAVDPIGRESKPSPVIKATPEDKIPPAVPEILSAGSIGRKVVLSWKISLESDAAGYNVFRSTGLDKEFRKQNKNVIPVEQTSFIDSTVLSGVQYFYTVNAIDKNKNESKQSNSASVIPKDELKPGEPSALSYKLNKNIVLLNWKSSPAKDLLGYYIFRGDSKETQARITSGIIKATSFADSGYLKNGFQPGSLCFAVSSVDSSYNESEKIFVQVYIPDQDPPIPPTNFFVENFEGRYITINKGTSISQDVDSYNIYKAEPGQKALLIKPGEATSGQLFDSLVIKGKYYTYFSTAVDTAGNESKPGIPDTILFRDFSPPPSVVNLTIKAGQQGIDLEWEKVIDFDLAGYFVLRSELPNGIYKKLHVNPLGETKYSDVSGSNKYYYKVVSVDTSGNLSEAEDFVYVP